MKSATVLLLCLPVLCMPMPSVAADQQPLTHVFSDWQASCSSIAAACAGWAVDATGEATVIVRRANAAQVDWELELQLPGLIDTQTLVASAGAQQVTLRRNRDWLESGIAGEVWLVDADVDHDQAAASQLFVAMNDADTLQVTVDTSAAATPYVFSLRGLKASLLWMDDTQGNKDAWPLVQAPASIHDVAPSLHKLQRHYTDEATLADINTLPSAVRALRVGAQDCQPLAEATDGRGYQVQWLDANTALFSIACALTPRDPLDLHVIAHAPDFKDARVITFPLWDGSQPPLSHPLAKPRTDAVTTLSMPILLPVFDRLQLRQQDNHGGLEQTWHWDGRAMQLIEVRHRTLQGETQGSWQVLWQSLAVQR